MKWHIFMTSSICLSLVSAKTLFSCQIFLYKRLPDFARCRDFLNSWMRGEHSLPCQGNLAAGNLLGPSIHPSITQLVSQT